MNYIALHHVRLGGETFTPGEYIDERIPPEQLDRLLARGAIRVTQRGEEAPEEAEGLRTYEEPEYARAEAEEAEESFEAPSIDATEGLVEAEEEAPPPKKGRAKK